MKPKLSTKEQIVQTAGRHFSEYGYEGTYLESVAKECGITKPAIYYHFKDKASLYEAVLVKYFSELAQAIEKNTLQDDPRENLSMYVRTFGNYLIATPSFSAIFSREIANDAKSLPDSCIAELSKTLKRLLQILEKGEEEGIFRCENPFMIQMMIVTTLSAYLTTKDLRRRVSLVLTEHSGHLDPGVDDVIENLSGKIIKALSC